MPSKFCFLLWLLYFNRALKLDNLKKRGLQLANRCCLCGRSEESAAHLFLHCHVASNLWGGFVQQFRLQAFNGWWLNPFQNWFFNGIKTNERFFLLEGRCFRGVSFMWCAGLFGGSTMLVFLKIEEPRVSRLRIGLWLFCIRWVSHLSLLARSCSSWIFDWDALIS